MQSAHEFLKTLTIVLGTAALTTVLFQRLKQPVVLGYLVAGMIVGPHVPIPLHADLATTRTLSELGVILLMFTLGLEFSLRKLVKVGPKAAFIAVVECSLMIWLGYVTGQLFGWNARERLYAGGIIAISSTTIIVKAFEESSIRGKFRETVFGVLIVEDLIAILLLTIFTTLSSGESVSARTLGMTAGRLAAFLAALLTVGLVVVPRLVRLTVRLQRPETTVVAAMGICFACALLAHSFGYSVALGAFVAGALIAESGEERRVEQVITPVRDVFGAIFFVSVGMLIDPRLIAANWLAVLALTVAVVVGKTVFVSVSSFFTGAGIRQSVQVGMTLAQIGEFSFIIAALGITLGATRSFLFPVAVAVSAVTTLLTPWLIRAAAPFASWVDRKLPATLQTFVTLYGSWIEDIGQARQRSSKRASLRPLLRVLLVDGAVLAAIVIAAGASVERLTSVLVARVGVSVRVAHAILVAAAVVLVTPFLIGAVRIARRLGYQLAVRAMPSADPGAPGPDSASEDRASASDSASPPVAPKLDLAEAPRKALIVMLQLSIVVLLGAPLVAVTQPFVPTFYVAILFAVVLVVLGVRFWRTATDLQGHVRAASQVIAEALALQARQAEKDRKADGLSALRTLLPGLGAPAAVHLGKGAHAIGKSLAELNLRGQTGASVLALTRADGHLVAPSPTEKLSEGDLLAMAGSEEAVAAAGELLERGPEWARVEGPAPGVAGEATPENINDPPGQ